MKIESHTGLGPAMPRDGSPLHCIITKSYVLGTVRTTLQTVVAVLNYSC